MKVCVVGSGAREHALAHVLATSADVVATPGNPGISGRSASGHQMSSTDQPPGEIEADLFVIGPEAPLVAGLADELRAAGRLVFGPGADGARLEGSKEFMKAVAASAGVPTARWGAFSELESACRFLRELPGPFVVKTDGLAAGKGVLVTTDLDEALEDVAAKLSGTSFGDAGRRVVIEEGLSGNELSLLIICDGTHAFPLSPAQDFKRAGDGDTGPNTGGMGAFAPVGIPDDTVEVVMDTIVEPTLSTLRRDGIDYRGVLYAGLMLTRDGPKLIEYNVRFGDPEAQVVLPLFPGDLADLLADAANGDLRAAASGSGASGGSPSSCARELPARAAVCVVAAAPGYPSSPTTGEAIEGVDEAGRVEGVIVFHAATRTDSNGVLRTSGGRVLAVTGLGDDLDQARGRAYEAIGAISSPGLFFRHDIAADAPGSETSR